MDYDPKEPLKGLGGLYGEGFSVGICDGSVRFVFKSVDPKILRALMTAAGGEVIEPF